ncbi:kinase-like protein [Suillus placidus]|uniref:Kinase-like protein n=1 Tax=Suillus placidus TaxID=48579 RepID=A0A9P7A7W1_9AGAM|nr:kinase-like protein [Suillus placidus]
MYANTWAWDFSQKLMPNGSRNNSYVAVKVLTGKATDMDRQNIIWEVPTLNWVSSPPHPHCLRLLSDFTIPGKGSSGEHICLVTQILGGDVKSLCEAHGKILPLPLAKRVLLHTLRGIAHAHGCGVVHTDLKPDNIFFDARMSNTDFAKLLESGPSRRHPPEESHDGIMQAAVSQPLPIPSLQEALQITFVLADFGNAQPTFAHMHDEITAGDLRPPEFFLGGPWNETVDIWSFGCLIFELTIGQPFFRFRPFPPLDLDEINYMLHQMIGYTCQDFSLEQLAVSQRAADFFDEIGYLKSALREDQPFETSIRCYHVIEEEDVLSTAALMRRCLRLDPTNRASAAELLADPWFAGIDPI